MTIKELKTSDNVLKNFVDVSGQFKVWELVQWTKKELSSSDCYYLRYCLMRFIENNQGRVYEYIDMENEKTLYYEVDSEASICDNSLCMGNFEGYQIDDDLYIKDLELSIENRVILNVYNDKEDSYTSYLID